MRAILTQAQQLGNVCAVCRAHGISEQTFYRWRRRFPSVQSDALRLRDLEKENEALRRTVAWMFLQNYYFYQSRS